MLQGSSLTSTDAEGRDTKSIKGGEWLKRMSDVVVDKIIVVGAPSSWAGKTEVQLDVNGEKTPVKITYHKAEGGKAAFAILGRVGARISADWEIDFA